MLELNDNENLQQLWITLVTLRYQATIAKFTPDFRQKVGDLIDVIEGQLEDKLPTAAEKRAWQNRRATYELSTFKTN